MKFWPSMQINCNGRAKSVSEMSEYEYQSLTEGCLVLQYQQLRSPLPSTNLVLLDETTGLNSNTNTTLDRLLQTLLVHSDWSAF